MPMPTIRLTTWRLTSSSASQLMQRRLSRPRRQQTARPVANNTNISITFSEAVDVTGNWFQIVGATSGTKNVADTTVTGGPTTFDINPADFANGELVTVTVFAAQVSDQDTNDPPENMVASFVFSFTIDQAPSVTATTPTNGATDVAINSNVTITFSEPVNVTGNWFQMFVLTAAHVTSPIP